MKRLFGWVLKACGVFVGLIVLLVILGAIVGPQKSVPAAIPSTNTPVVVQEVRTVVPVNTSTEVPTSTVVPTETPNPTDTTVPTDTPEPAPTAVPTASSLLDVEGSASKNTDEFTTDGNAFEVAWNVRSTDASLGTPQVIITLKNGSGAYLDEVVWLSNDNQNSTMMHDDCSSGCYLDISDVNADWHVIAYGYAG